MFSEVTWKSLEQYREFVVNGLDILSFLLVTPEILRIARPAVHVATMLIYTIVSVLLFLLVITVMSFAIFHILDRDTPLPFLIWIVAVYFGGMGFSVFIGGQFSLLTKERVEWVGAHALLAGGALFIVSRTFSLIVAAHQLFGGITT